MFHNIDKLKDRRRELRKKSTPVEKILWAKLRDNQLSVKFKRQHSIGGYILDFYCSKFKLIIELDGFTHNKHKAKEYDKIRDKYFSELDYQVLRFFNREIKNNLKEVLIKIKSCLKHSSPSQGEVR